MNCRELAKKKSEIPLWEGRMIDLLWETLKTPAAASAHFILPPEKHRKAEDKSRTGV